MSLYLYGVYMVLLSYTYNKDDLHTFCGIEESLPENTPVCVRLTFDTTELDELCEQINNKCQSIGVTLLLDNYAYKNGNNIDIYWVKGLSWWGLILAAILTLILPPIIAAAIYALLPENWRNVIDAMMTLSIFGFITYMFYKITVGLAGGE